jgi:uncharacterized protein (TIGR01777 family)
MKVVITGSSGLIGTALLPTLRAAGHTVVRLVRGTLARGVARWDPESGRLDPAVLEGADAVVHLAGESIAAPRWTRAKKERIRNSRVHGTALLSRALSALDRKPRIFLSASAVGFYGNRRDEYLDETSAKGRGFLADVCEQWEEAPRAAADAGIPVVTMRMGIVLSQEGGALRKLLTPFRFGLGGTLGAGTQYMSWIAIDDVVGAIMHLLRTSPGAGPVNLVAPEPVTNREFTEALGRVLQRPTVLSIPAFALRAVFGEMADEMLLTSARVHPALLAATGYRFRYSDLEAALRHVLR